MIKRVKIISGFLVVCRKLGCTFFISILQLYTCKFSHSFYVVRLPVWCIKLSGAGVILRSHKFHNHLFCLLPLPVLYHLTVLFSPRASPLHPLLQNMGNLYSRWGHKSINLSVSNSNKVAFVMHESQKVASKLFMIRSFICHFWSVFITSLWVGQINCVWGSMLVLATESCV